MSDPAPVLRDGRVLRCRIARGLHGTLDGEALPVVHQVLVALGPEQTFMALTGRPWMDETSSHRHQQPHSHLVSSQ